MKVDELRRILAPLDGDREVMLPVDTYGIELEHVQDVSFELMGRGEDGRLFLRTNPLDESDVLDEGECACVVFWPEE